MNKKLFSWKALAGLALLVAMGLTSCKQGEEVDPSNPTAKPAKPSSSLDGDYDWEVSITNTGDFLSQWNSVKEKVVKALDNAEAEEVSIKVNCGKYALDGKTIDLDVPGLFGNNFEGKTINVVFSGAFKSKTVDDVEQVFTVDASDLAGAEVNIYLPADEFKMKLNATGTKTTLYSESATTLSTLDATADAVKKNALTIDEKITVKGIKMSGAIVATTDNVLAKLVSGTEALEKGKGARVGTKDVAELFVKNLILTGNTTVNGADEAALDNITIPESTKLTLGAKKSQVKKIEGLGTAKKPSTVAFAGDEDDFTKIGAFSNVVLSGTTTTNVKDFSIFENVVFNIPVNLYTNAANTEFGRDVNVKFGDDVDEIAFTNVEFANSTAMTVKGAVKITGKMKSVAMYQWDKSSKNYVAIDDEKDVYETNTDYVEITQSVWNATRYATAMGKDSLKMEKGKFTFPELETANKALETAKKAYEAAIEANGLETANGSEATLGTIAPSTLLKAYIDAYEVVNGDCNYEIYKKDADGNWLDKDGEITTNLSKRVPVKAAPAPKKTQTNVGLVGKDANLFMNAVNAKIGDADWFEIYYANEITSTPEDVTVSFDADCTIGGADITVKKLNKMINVDADGYVSKKDIFFDVEYDGETFQWAGTSSDGFYLK